MHFQSLFTTALLATSVSAATINMCRKVGSANAINKLGKEG